MNPGVSAYAYCVRNAEGDLVYAKGATIEYTTNTEMK